MKIYLNLINGMLKKVNKCKDIRKQGAVFKESNDNQLIKNR